MIFITVGTEQYPFNRLIKSIDVAISQGQLADTVFGQIGTSTYIPTCFEYKRFLPYEEMISFIQQADVVVSHAGIGSILTCLTCQKSPILFPRSRKFKEHVDDHQVEFMRAMIKHNKLLWAHDETDIISKILSSCDKTFHMNQDFFRKDEKNLAEYLRTII